LEEMMKKLSLYVVTILVLLVVVGATVTSVSAQGPSTTPTSVGTQRAARLEAARSVAAKIFDNHFLNRLNALRAKVSANDRLGTEAKQALLRKIDAEITWFTSKKNELATATTIAELRTIVKDARARFQNIAKEVRLLYIARGFVVSLEKVITNLENNIIAKIERKLTELSNNGVDVSVERALVAKAKAEVVEAKSELVLTTNSVTFEEAKKHFEAAKGHVKSARQDLKEALRSLKNKV